MEIGHLSQPLILTAFTESQKETQPARLENFCSQSGDSGLFSSACFAVSPEAAATYISPYYIHNQHRQAVFYHPPADRPHLRRRCEVCSAIISSTSYFVVQATRQQWVYAKPSIRRSNRGGGRGIAADSAKCAASRQGEG